MRVARVETFVLSNRRALVRIETDDGVVGWGEPVLENWALTTVAAVERMAEHLIGQDPRATTRIWQVLTRGGFYRGGPVLGSAVAGIDQALWDIKGKALGVPVHELLGGPTRDRVRAYAHANGRSGHVGDPDRARALVAAGYTMLKVAPASSLRFIESPRAIDAVVDDVAELRAAVGDGVDLAIDLHGRASIATSRVLLPLLEPFRLAFVEEPLRPEHSGEIRRVVESTSVPIATGERLYSREEFRPVLEAGIALAQPDLSHAGGITECLRIGTLAESYDVRVAPHCPLGPVALAACLQLDLALPNVFAQEMPFAEDGSGTYGAGSGLELLRNPEVFALDSGFVPRLTGPGLGIDVDDAAVRAAVAPGPLEPGSPVWTDDEGAFTEW